MSIFIKILESDIANFLVEYNRSTPNFSINKKELIKFIKEDFFIGLDGMDAKQSLKFIIEQLDYESICDEVNQEFLECERTHDSENGFLEGE